MLENPEKYATKMQCAMHVPHTGSPSHIPAPARIPAHPHTHTVTQLVAQILALHILWRLKFLWQFARRATLGRKSHAKCEAKCGANGIVALKCGQRRTKTVQERATTKVRPKEKDRERERGIKEWGEMWLVK